MEILLIEWGCGSRGLGSGDRRERAPLGSPGSSPKCASPTVNFTTLKRPLGFQSLWQEFLSKQTFPGGLLIKLFRVKLFAYFGETPCLTPSWGQCECLSTFTADLSYMRITKFCFLRRGKSSIFLDFSLNSKQDYRHGKTPSAHPSTKTVEQFSDPHGIKLLWFLEERKVWSLLSI